jgi:hypothetical protein
MTECLPCCAGVVMVVVVPAQAFIKAAMKLKNIAKGSDSAALMKNHCLVTAILKQHMVPGRFDTAALKDMESRPSMLVTKKMVPNTKGKVTVSWPLKIDG